MKTAKSVPEYLPSLCIAGVYDFYRWDVDCINSKEAN
jgi:hypothetical protein